MNINIRDNLLSGLNNRWKHFYSVPFKAINIESEFRIESVSHKIWFGKMEKRVQDWNEWHPWITVKLKDSTLEGIFLFTFLSELFWKEIGRKGEKWSLIEKRWENSECVIFDFKISGAIYLRSNDFCGREKKGWRKWVRSVLCANWSEEEEKIEHRYEWPISAFSSTIFTCLLRVKNFSSSWFEK